MQQNNNEILHPPVQFTIDCISTFTACLDRFYILSHGRSFLFKNLTIQKCSLCYRSTDIIWNHFVLYEKSVNINVTRLIAEL